MYIGTLAITTKNQKSPLGVAPDEQNANAEGCKAQQHGDDHLGSQGVAYEPNEKHIRNTQKLVHQSLLEQKFGKCAENPL